MLLLLMMQLENLGFIVFRINLMYLMLSRNGKLWLRLIQERRFQYKTRMRKEENQAKVDDSENIKAIGQWSQERIYLCSMCKLSVGLVIQRISILKMIFGMGHQGLKIKGEEPSNSVYRSGQRSFNSRPAWTYSEAALKEEQRGCLQIRLEVI